MENFVLQDILVHIVVVADDSIQQGFLTGTCNESDIPHVQATSRSEV